MKTNSIKTLRTVVLAILISSIACVGLVGCVNVPNQTNGYSYVSLRINPEIELIVDSHGKVVGVNAVNEDGEVVIAELDIIGQSVDAAGEMFTQKATQLGYLDADSDNVTVYVDVVGEDSEGAEKIKKGLAEKINRYFDNNGIYGKVSQDTLDKYAANAQEWNVSVGHAKMILRILDMYPQMSEEEILALSVSQRMALIKDNAKSNGIVAELRAQYKDEVKALKEEYADMFELEEAIEALKLRIQSETLTVEEKAELESQLVNMESEYNTTHGDYKNKLSDLKNKYRALSDEAVEQHKATHKAKKSDNANKIKLHEEKFKANSEKIKKDIKEWRKSQVGL